MRDQTGDCHCGIRDAAPETCVADFYHVARIFIIGLPAGVTRGTGFQA